MNKNYLIFSGLFICSAILLSSYNDSSFETTVYHKSPLNAGGAPAGKTGAPGENNCTGCHAGSTQDGTNENILVVSSGGNPVTSYTPGSTYQVSLAMASNPAKKGFQAIVLDANNSMAGDFSAGTGTNISSQGTKKYVNHTSASNSNATPTWIWDWTAPSPAVGSVTFYVASNSANNNQTSSGDVIYLSQNVIAQDSSSNLQEHSFFTDLNIGYNSIKNSVMIDFSSFKSGNLFVNITAMNGSSVYSANLGASNIGENNLDISLNKRINQGIYIVNLFIDNVPSSKKIFIN